MYIWVNEDAVIVPKIRSPVTHTALKNNTLIGVPLKVTYSRGNPRNNGQQGILKYYHRHLDIYFQQPFLYFFYFSTIKNF